VRALTDPPSTEPVAVVFFPESAGMPPFISEWQARNPDWRRLVPGVIVCPVCGLTVRAMADYALLEADEVNAEIERYRDQHLRGACSDHWLPKEEYWAVVASRIG
jgi:hypothetical protein